MAGSLTIVGLGIRLVGHVTLETHQHLQRAEKLLYLVTDPVTEYWLRELNSTAETLADCYEEGQPRMRAYERMVERMLSPARRGLRTCAAFYGHPGVFVTPSHRALAVARREGLEAEMLPAVSAEDCLFVDLEVDPGPRGCQSFEATDFLLHRRRFDPSSCLVLWQIGAVGDPTFQPRRGVHRPGLRLLADTLARHYPPEHEVMIYRAAQYPIFDPVIRRVPLAGLGEAEVEPLATLFVPPLADRPVDPETKRLLGMGD